MDRTTEAIVQNGRVVIDDLPFVDGQRVRIIVSDRLPRSIADVRAELRGAVDKFESPEEPMIPIDSWETLR